MAIPQLRDTNRALPADDPRAHVISVPIAVTNLGAATDRIVAWAGDGVGRYVTLTNVHMVMEAHDSSEFERVVAGADLVLPDGMPTVWAQRWTGHPTAERVPGPQLTEALLREAAARRIPVAAYGGEEQVLRAFVARSSERYPGLRFVEAISPPFRSLTREEDREHTDRLARSGARIVFVGLGCPKQERWMSEHVQRIPAVLVGVGQALDIIAGAKRDAPRWMQCLGLGWLFRLLQEPRRLWRRYLTHNPRFISLLATQCVRQGVRRRS